MISVIIPAYNVEGYIEECLKSVVSQRGIDMEIIVVDDGSTDATGEIVDRYAAENDNVTVVHQANAGLSGARNSALALCHGNWITMVDGDDVLSENALITMRNAAEKEDADIVMGRFEKFANDRHRLTSVEKTDKSFQISGKESVEIMLYKRKLASTVNSSACGKLYRRNLWDNTRFKTGVLYEDLELIPRVCAKAQRVAVVDNAAYGYRYNPESILHTFTQRRCDALEATTELCDYFSNDKDLYKAAQSRRFSAAFNLWLLIVVNRADMPQEVGRCKAIVRTLAMSQLFGRKVRLKNRIGAILQYFPFIFRSAGLCKRLLAK